MKEQRRLLLLTMVASILNAIVCALNIYLKLVG